MTENTNAGIPPAEDDNKITTAITAPEDVVATSEAPPQTITTHMEVHHPKHVLEKKKWPEFLLEFLMLFLAVFLGFVAENIREHIGEKEKEKQYMRSLISDLAEDTAELHQSFVTATKALAYEDSVKLFIYQHPPKDYLPKHFLDLDYNAMLRLKVLFHEATALQLRNAGNMRLIHSPEIIRKISDYWGEQENTRISVDRYLNYRNRGREMSEKLYAFSDYDLVKAKLIAEPKEGVRVLQKDPAVWAEYANIQGHCSVTIGTYLEQLKKQSKLAQELVSLLEKEYHFD